MDIPTMVARVRPGVVTIIAGHAADSDLGGDPSSREHALGSGILIGSEGIVLTSYHVVDHADNVRVALHDLRSFKGRVTARDTWLDVALVKLEGAGNLPIMELGESAALELGDRVVALGNPFGLGISVTQGILSAKRRFIDSGPSNSFLQSDAALNPGDSGGPLLDVRGRVVGVNAALIEHGQGLCFAVPIDDVRSVLSDLLTRGCVARGHLAVRLQTVSGAIARALRLPREAGAIVAEVTPQSAAARGGLRVGDVVTSFEGHGVEIAAELLGYVAARRPGEMVHLGVLRNGRPETLVILVDRLSSDDGLPPCAETSGSGHGQPLGLRASDAEGGGARVDGLNPKSVAADEVHPGDIVVELNRRAVRNAADLQEQLRVMPRPTTALVRLRRAGSFVFTGIDLE